MTEDFILFMIFWAVSILTAKAAEEVSSVFGRRINNRRNQMFAQRLIVERKLSKLL